MPGKQELPDTLRRSGKRAQEMWVKVHALSRQVPIQPQEASTAPTGK